jgi:hypothetical protein
MLVPVLLSWGEWKPPVITLLNFGIFFRQFREFMMLLSGLTFHPRQIIAT